MLLMGSVPQEDISWRGTVGLVPYLGFKNKIGMSRATKQMHCQTEFSRPGVFKTKGLKQPIAVCHTPAQST